LDRVLKQGSRLSAVRLTRVHAACVLPGIERGLDKNHVCSNLSWLSEHQERIENRFVCGPARPASASVVSE
jgi:hypothetical protein